MAVLAAWSCKDDHRRSDVLLSADGTSVKPPRTLASGPWRVPLRQHEAEKAFSVSRPGKAVSLQAPSLLTSLRVVDGLGRAGVDCWLTG